MLAKNTTRSTTILLVSLLFSAGILAACQQERSEGLPTAAAGPSPTSVPNTPEPTATSIPPAVSTTALPTAAAQQSEPAASPTTIAATSTATATPDDPPAPHFNVEAAPHMASDCSPDYPCSDDIPGWEDRLRVPPGFEASYFTRVGGRPTSMAVGADGLLYVAVITGTIYTVDESGEAGVYFEGLNVPTGLAFEPQSGNLYVSNRLKDDYVAGEGQVSRIKDGRMTTVIDGLPCCYIGMHGPNGIAFGSDGFGYVGVGGRADHGEILFGEAQGEQDELHPFEASILRFSPDGELVESFARGFRNPYDIAFDAGGRLYATDNGRDGNRELGDDPPDEVHEVVPDGEHGYPYYECDNCFGIPDDIDLIPPLHELIPHGAVTGITAYLDDEFPGYYDDLFLVLWSAFEGAQKVMRIGRDRTEISDFATGFAAPIDIVVGNDGNLYVADFGTGIIFKISYTGNS